MRRKALRTRGNRLTITATATALALIAAAGGSLTVPTAAAAARVSCGVSYAVNDWGSGFTANLTITDTGTTAIDGWTLGYAYTGDQTLQNGWNGTWTQTGRTVTV
ncbi:cellulose binding domain-containing protein, partial [Streptomyces sp. SP17BM10]|uniref:cellulose binding domain-containing protein n=1 Tax=Streptomyces sp. SP17BM10 TaxID=3002530 RepID=UPI002E75B65B